MIKKLRYLFLCTIFAFNFALAQTNVSGGIFANTTYTLANSPYIVTDHLVLFPNFTLTIEPGVEFKFDSGKRLEIRGELIAIGNSSNRITFTSNATTPNKGDWTGVQIKNSLGAKASFEYCNFEYASTSTHAECCHDGGPIYYSHCKFENNTTAVGGYTAYDINMDYCEFNNNTYGITQADKIVTNATFTNNDFGLYQTERISIYNSTFTNNGTALYGGRGVIDNTVITNNTIGVQSFFEGFEIRNSDISNNDVGIKTGNYSGGAAVIEENTICDNTTYNVENLDNINKDLTSNCWCLEDVAAIEAKLKDGYDDVNLGLFNYSIYDPTCTQITANTIKDPTLPAPPPLSNEEFEAILSTIYPNPSSDTVTVQLNNTLQNVEISLFSIEGQLVYKNTLQNSASFSISLDRLPASVYIMKLKTNKGIVTSKIVKE
ncbi:T9SS type A sorting domain-containing protein [Kordia jejudonensis]|uniref:T9SS type A sorting domain-containing protein n=1 Tax=Kordia jejudonensis TaxID=1348245 RepID=UPI0006291B9E|nr:T9SS type A sorting domain-containing protein [Kordia jejudonensis]